MADRSLGSGIGEVEQLVIKLDAPDGKNPDFLAHKRKSTWQRSDIRLL